MQIAARPVFLGNADLLICAVAKCLVGHYNGVKVVDAVEWGSGLKKGCDYDQTGIYL